MAREKKGYYYLNFDYKKEDRKPCECAECIAYGEYVMWLESLEKPQIERTIEKLKRIAWAYDTKVRFMLEHKDCWQPRDRSVYSMSGIESALESITKNNEKKHGKD
jgi:hypothetical protein